MSLRVALPQTVVVLLLLCLYVWDRTVLSIALPDLARTLLLRPWQTGAVATGFAAGVVLSALPAGLLAKKFGDRPILVLGATIFSAATALVPIASGFTSLLLSRVTLGVGEGLFNISMLLFLGQLSRVHRGLLIGASASVFGIAHTVGPGLIRFIHVSAGSWQTAFRLLAFGGGVLTFLLTSLPRTQDSNIPHAAPVEHPVTVRDMLSIWPLLLLVAACGIAIYSVTGLLAVWTRGELGLSALRADLLLSATGLGFLLGGAPLGAVADRVGLVRYSTCAMFVTGASGALLMGIDSGPILGLVVAVVFGAASNSAYVTAIAIAHTRGQGHSAVFVGCLATIFYAAAFASAPLLMLVRVQLGPTPAALLVYLPLSAVSAVLVALLVPPVVRLARGAG